MKTKIALAASLSLLAVAAQAADWSDTSLSYRWGTKYAEPYNTKDVKKNILNLSHVSGYKYGTNFVSVDLLNSDANDGNAQEAYVVYRHTVDLGKVTGKAYGFGPVKGMGLTAGFDWNTKNDAGYSSRKRMLVAGPTFFMAVPAGFLNVTAAALFESNQPVTGFGQSTRVARYDFDTHGALLAAWGIPLGAGFSFEGYANWIAAKGKDEFGGATSPEFNFDGQVMYDLSSTVGLPKSALKAGVQYQYWRNKFGNPHSVPGTLAKTPQLRVEYHF
ncbi:outer envelope protein [Ramlibacter sp. MAHUQ-53]|uniref:outer envelope protein n=1 Tax=unclassified Ramlibacter TaxID=2617605 RepID=UPI003631CF09